MSGTSDILRDMARLRRALEKRMRRDDRAEELAARERAGDRGKMRCGPLASFDTPGLAGLLRPMLEFDGRGWRAIAAEMGVTSPDLSRVMARQDISAAKVFAICDWAGLDPRAFYRPALGAPKPRKRPRRTVKPGGRAGPKVGEMFHGKSTETGKLEQA